MGKEAILALTRIFPAKKKKKNEKDNFHLDQLANRQVIMIRFRLFFFFVFYFYFISVIEDRAYSVIPYYIDNKEGEKKEAKHESCKTCVCVGGIHTVLFVSLFFFFLNDKNKKEDE